MKLSELIFELQEIADETRNDPEVKITNSWSIYDMRLPVYDTSHACVLIGEGEESNMYDNNFAYENYDSGDEDMDSYNEYDYYEDDDDDDDDDDGYYDDDDNEYA